MPAQWRGGLSRRRQCHPGQQPRPCTGMSMRQRFPSLRHCVRASRRVLSSVSARHCAVHPTWQTSQRLSRCRKRGLGGRLLGSPGLSPLASASLRLRALRSCERRSPRRRRSAPRRGASRSLRCPAVPLRPQLHRRSHLESFMMGSTCAALSRCRIRLHARCSGTCVGANSESNTPWRAFAAARPLARSSAASGCVSLICVASRVWWT
jgi:hypothetical protein